MTRTPREPVFGAVPLANGGVRFRVWAPTASGVDLHLRRPGGQVCVSPLRGARSAGIDDPQTGHPEGAKRRPDPGIWELLVPDTRTGDHYAFAVDGGPPRPDPAGRFLPDGVHGWSEVIDPRAFAWTDAAWNGLDPRRAVIYELHVGTFSPEGTFRGAAARLPHLRNLGITAIELMPVADFAGRRNWGYDGVAMFAPAHGYGSPDDLRALVDTAHAHGIGVILDVVYNHLGPEGAYLPELSPLFLTDKHSTPWGDAVNLDDEGSSGVRAFLTDNALHWVDEYHMDGLRLDATHSLHDSRDRHFVAELAEAVHASTDPPPVVYAEDHRNLSTMLNAPDHGGWNLDGVWADDFHHVVRRMVGGDSHGYYVDYEGTAAELAATLRQGWLFVGQHSVHQRGARGTDPSSVPLRKAIVCVQNHDQVGNRALGDRLHHTIDAASWRAAVTVLLTAPMTPLLFMGQEWATSAPFQFFTDFETSLGDLVFHGRRQEFKAFPQFATAEGARRVPNPQAESTFEASRLRWDELDRPDHARVLALHRALLRLRREYAFMRASDACDADAQSIGGDTVVFRRGSEDAGSALVVVRLRGCGLVKVPAMANAQATLLDTEDAAFAGDPRPARIHPADGAIEFARPGALVVAERT